MQYSDVLFDIDFDLFGLSVVVDQIFKPHGRFIVSDCRDFFAFDDTEQKPLQWRQDGRHPADDDLLQAFGLVEHCSDFGIKHLKVHRDHNLCFTVGDLECELTFNIQRVVVDYGGTGTQCAKIANDRVRGIGQAQADPAPFCDAHVLKALGSLSNMCCQLRVGGFPTEKVNCWPVSEPDFCIIDVLIESPTGQRCGPVNPFGVMVQPRLWVDITCCHGFFLGMYCLLRIRN